MKASVNSFAIGAGIAIVAIVAVYLVARKTGAALGDAAQAVGTAVNPVSDQNLAYKGVNAVGAAVSGDQSFSLGSWLYSVTHPNEAQTLGLTSGLTPGG